MRRRIITRILWLFPALLFVSMLVFFITQPQVDLSKLNDQPADIFSVNQLHSQSKLPLFYFTVTSLNEPDTVWKMTGDEKEKLRLNSSWKKYVPAIHFHADNQYHRWLFGDDESGSKGILRGDFGKSAQTGLPVTTQLLPRFCRSFVIVFVSLLLAFFISIPVSVFMVLNPQKLFSKTLHAIFLVLYIAPTFWIAVLLLMLFANPKMFSVFPLSGWPESGSGFLSYCYHLILPVTCYSLGAIAYFTRMLETNLKEILHSEFITTARAKGLAQTKSVFRHALPHAIIPSLTLLGYLFPLAVSGSVIIETVFSIPGMSQMLYQAALAQDVPVLAAICVLSCLLTLTGFLLTEILQAFIDPRLRNYSQPS